ncbi:hypothetical protein C4D60_Mb04t10580 [Musa balbisiana]|uniref:Anaphase-promoting complex subunit 4 WD40 domain-containing protein n=1 Tax=Musa balbisiana TaxID=52838 RepID=A0A4V4H9N6_MUSBA|nr:hypothetical protein C4D60_Mb04t10580 [Musa balbisiana]
MSAATLPPTGGRELSNPPSDGISNLRFSNHSDLLLVSSWDRSLRLYDAGADALKGEFAHVGPVLDCCFHDDSSGFSACADHMVRRFVFGSGKEDILGCHDAPVRFALSSVEGRVAMEFFDLSEAAQAKNYGTFATGGCDGYVNVWDGNNKKRLYQYSKYPTSIAALSFSRDGRQLAVASSYTFEEGDMPQCSRDHFP